MSLLSDVEFFRPGYIRGFVFDSVEPSRRWVVGLYVNGQLITAGLAEFDFAGMSKQQDVPLGCGFEFNLNTAILRDTDQITLTLVNSDKVLLETSFAAIQEWRDPSEREGAGFVYHGHGLTLSGIVDNGVTEVPSYEVLAFDGDKIVGRTRLYRWQHIGDPKRPQGKSIAFDLLVDSTLADGVPRKLRIETATGVTLQGSPVDFIAYPNDFRAACRAVATRQNSTKADMALNRLLENSMPLTAYADLYPDLETQTAQPTAGGRLADGGVWRAVAETDWVLVHHAAVTPRSDMAGQLKAVVGSELVYFDLAVRRGGQLFPLLFPAFDMERMLEQGYAGLCFALSVKAFHKAMEPAAASVFELLLRCVADLERVSICHVPHPGGLLDEEGLAGSVDSLFQALLSVADLLPPGTQIKASSASTFPSLRLCRPIYDRGVSVIIPTRNEGPMLKTCIDSLIAQNAEFDLDILVVDNGTTDPDTQAILIDLEERGVRVLEFNDGFNFSVINNLAAEHALHEQLCFLNNDTEFTSPGVLDELCSRLSDPSVGAVGPLMARASDIIQHGGVILGPHHGACHAFEDRMRHDPGYGELLKVAREVSAVTGAMLMTRKSLFLEMGGFEEQLFSVNFNDVDYCLRLWSQGRRVIFTPHVWVRHYESVSRGREAMTPASHRMMREVANLRLRWKDVIRNDPFFHPLFSIDALPYRALSTQHRDPAPRWSVITPSSELPRWI